jgi:hypothetical protein
MDTHEHRLTIWLSAEVVAALKEWAKAHSRSLNSAVDWALRQYIARQRGERKREQRS